MPSSRSKITSDIFKEARARLIKRILTPSCFKNSNSYYSLFKTNAGRKAAESAQKMSSLRMNSNILLDEISALNDIVDQEKIQDFEDQMDEYFMEALYGNFSDLANYLNCLFSAENFLIGILKKLGSDVDKLRNSIDGLYKESLRVARDGTKVQKRNLQLMQQGLRRNVGEGVIELENIQGILFSFKASIDEFFVQMAHNPALKLQFEQALPNLAVSPEVALWARKKLSNISNDANTSNADDIADMLNAITLRDEKPNQIQRLGMAI